MAKAHINRGKWSQSGVPHAGWNCIGIEDLGEPSEICGMCESVQIRYVHFMTHPNYSETLGVGCICAEHMEEDYVGPRAREKKLKSKAQRRKLWAIREWRTSTKGNFYLNSDGFNLTIFEKTAANGKQWGIRVIHRESGRKQFGSLAYQSENAAKRAAFDALLWAKEHLVRT